MRTTQLMRATQAIFFMAFFLSYSPVMANSTGLLFNVSLTENTLNIKTTVPGYNYRKTGFKILSGNYTLAQPTIDCYGFYNGYCLFPANSNNEHPIRLNGSGPLNATLCLNAFGPVSCEKFSFGYLHHAYITNIVGNVSVCNIENNGDLVDCTDAGGTGFNSPAGIRFNNTTTYIVNSGNNSIRKCTTTLSGELNDCQDANATSLSLPESIALNKAKNQAYVTNALNNEVTLCDINENGLFLNCISAGASGLVFPEGIVLDNSKRYVYVANFLNNNVTKCIINQSSGVFSSCTDSGGTGFSFPVDIVINKSGTLAYISNNGSEDINLCHINPIDGSFNECQTTGDHFNGPEGIALNTDNTIAYVVNFNNNSVTQCNIAKTSGELTACRQRVFSALNLPFFIALD